MNLFPTYCTSSHMKVNSIYLNIFLTVHLRIIPVGNQPDAQFLLWYVYLNPLRVSSNFVLILRRTIVLIQQLVWSLCVSDRPVCRTRWNSFWGWAHSCSKHVQDSKNCIIEDIVRQVGYLPELILNVSAVTCDHLQVTKVTQRLKYIIVHKWALPTQPWQRPVTIWAYKPEAANTV